MNDINETSEIIVMSNCIANNKLFGQVLNGKGRISPHKAFAV